METRSAFARARALLLAVAVLLAGATPAAAGLSPPPDQGLSRIHAAVTWVPDRLPDGAGLTGDPERGVGMDPNGAPRAGVVAYLVEDPERGGALDPNGFDAMSGDPTEDPERGGHLDPNG